LSERSSIYIRPMLYRNSKRMRGKNCSGCKKFGWRSKRSKSNKESAEYRQGDININSNREILREHCRKAVVSKFQSLRSYSRSRVSKAQADSNEEIDKERAATTVAEALIAGTSLLSRLRKTKVQKS